MKLNTAMNIVYMISLLVTLAAAILILREWSGPGGSAEVSTLAYSLLLLGMIGLGGTLPIYLVTKLGWDKILGLNDEQEAAGDE